MEVKNDFEHYVLHNPVSMVFCLGPSTSSPLFRRVRDYQAQSAFGKSLNSASQRFMCVGSSSNHAMLSCLTSSGEGGAQDLSSIAHYVASSVTSAVSNAMFSFLTTKPLSSAATPSSVTTEQSTAAATPTTCFFSFSDANRRILSWALSPRTTTGNQLLAVSDSLGRVWIMDTQTGVVVRMW